MLDVQGLRSGYGPVEVLSGLSLHAGEGEVVAVLGANGAGKSTLMNTLVGLVPTRAGAIRFAGEDVTRQPTEDIVTAGMTLVPEGRRVFARLTVAENLRMGAYGRRDAEARPDQERLLERFPILGERRDRPAGTLSGGEQQQLAIARALMSRPKLILLDEPSLGLAPVIVDVVFDLIRDLNQADGLTVMLVEQSISHALDLADRVYVLSAGEIVREGIAAEMAGVAQELEESYLGGPR